MGDGTKLGKPKRPDRLNSTYFHFKSLISFLFGARRPSEAAVLVLDKTYKSCGFSWGGLKRRRKRHGNPIKEGQPFRFIVFSGKGKLFRNKTDGSYNYFITNNDEEWAGQNSLHSSAINICWSIREREKRCREIMVIRRIGWWQVIKKTYVRINERSSADLNFKLKKKVCHQLTTTTDGRRVIAATAAFKF